MHSIDCHLLKSRPSTSTIHITQSVSGSENVKSAHPSGELRKSSIMCLNAAAMCTSACSPARLFGVMRSQLASYTKCVKWTCNHCNYSHALTCFLLLWLWLWPNDLHTWTWPVPLNMYLQTRNELSRSRFSKLWYYRNAYIDIWGR